MATRLRHRRLQRWSRMSWAVTFLVRSCSPPVSCHLPRAILVAGHPPQRQDRPSPDPPHPRDAGNSICIVGMPEANSATFTFHSRSIACSARAVSLIAMPSHSLRHRRGSKGLSICPCADSQHRCVQPSLTSAQRSVAGSLAPRKDRRAILRSSHHTSGTKVHNPNIPVRMTDAGGAASELGP